jgi:hypothetical protein
MYFISFCCLKCFFEFTCELQRVPKKTRAKRKTSESDSGGAEGSATDVPTPSKSKSSTKINYAALESLLEEKEERAVTFAEPEISNKSARKTSTLSRRPAV